MKTLEEKNREYVIRETKRQIEFWLVVALVVILAGLVVALALAADSPVPVNDKEAKEIWQIWAVQNSVATQLAKSLTDQQKQWQGQIDGLQQQLNEKLSKATCPKGTRAQLDKTGSLSCMEPAK